MSIDIVSPTRVDLAGGTLDCWPLYSFLESPSLTINLNIDVKTGAHIVPRPDQSIHIESKDLQWSRQFSNLDECLLNEESEFLLIKEVVRYFAPKQGFELQVFSQSPVGGGLGGSSSLMASLVKAFAKWQASSLSEYQLVELCHNLEARLLKTPTGTQDYFPAFFGPLNFIWYRPEGIEVENPKVNLNPLVKNLSLIYTGRPHHSGINNWDVIQRVVAKEKKVLYALEEIRRVAIEMAGVLRREAWNEMQPLFELELKARVQLTPQFASPEINAILQEIKTWPQTALKICGAGGGGCILLWSQSANLSEVERLCQEKNLKRIHFQEMNPQNG